MVAESPSGLDQDEGRTRSVRPRSNMLRLVQTVMRLLSIQAQLALARTKLTAKKIMLYVALMALAVAATIIGLVFLLIGLFRAMSSILAYVVGPEWASTLSFIIWAIVLFGAAIVMVFFATRIFAPAESSEIKQVEGAKQQESPSKEQA